jgi:hypothetical protein
MLCLVLKPKNTPKRTVTQYIFGLYSYKDMESLQDIMSKKDFTPPDEVAAVKEFITRRYKSSSTVRVERDVLIVRVPSSALAATIQLEQRIMIEKCRITRRLIIRYGR